MKNENINACSNAKKVQEHKKAKEALVKGKEVEALKKIEGKKYVKVDNRTYKLK